jgi:hypothetical protein
MIVASAIGNPFAAHASPGLAAREQSAGRIVRRFQSKSSPDSFVLSAR